jgi:hypothetical protein
MCVLFIIYTALHVSAYMQAIFRCYLTILPDLFVICQIAPEDGLKGAAIPDELWVLEVDRLRLTFIWYKD